MPWGDKGGWQGDHGPWGQPPNSGGPKGKDPKGGSDWEEMLRRLLMQWRGAPGGGDNGRLIVLGAAALAALWLASGIYFVKADEQGVVKRFGVYTRTSGSGLNYHLPYPIETVEVPRVTSINHIEIGFRSGGRSHADAPGQDESLMLTGDENIIDIDFEVQWKIANAPDYLFNMRSPERTVKVVAESAMREVIGKNAIANVLAEGKLQVEQDTKHLIQDMLNAYKAGIEVVAVNLLQADPPSQVIDAFRDVQTARTDLETARNQAEAYRNDILPRARGDAQKMVLDAEAYRQKTVAQAQGEAARFSSIYNEYKQSKDVTRRRLYLEAMEDVLQGMPKIVLEGRGTQGVLPYLPLPELKAGKAEEASK